MTTILMTEKVNSNLLSGKVIKILYGSLLEGVTVCAGFSKTLKHILEQIGIECRYITGAVENGRDSRHAWNQVKINGGWYNSDLTWDENNIKNNKPLEYCLKGKNDETFASRTLDKEYDHLDISKLNFDEIELDINRRKVEEDLSHKDYKLKFPRLAEMEDRAYLFKKGATREEVKQYIIARAEAKTEEEKEILWEKHYASKLKHREEAKMQATKSEESGSLDNIIEFLIHCRDRGMSVYIDFKGHKLYSCDFNLSSYITYMETIGLTLEEHHDLFQEYSKLETEEEKQTFFEKYTALVAKNKEEVEQRKQEERRLLEKYYPDFVKTIEEKTHLTESNISIENVMKNALASGISTGDVNKTHEQEEQTHDR